LLLLLLFDLKVQKIESDCFVVVFLTKGFDMDYLDLSRDQQWYEYIKIPLRFLLLNSLMIPISLKVIIDFAMVLLLFTAVLIR
jgi:hypothetical protein